jgi:hypothetical protein
VCNLGVQRLKERFRRDGKQSVASKRGDGQQVATASSPVFFLCFVQGRMCERVEMFCCLLDSGQCSCRSRFDRPRIVSFLLTSVQLGTDIPCALTHSKYHSSILAASKLDHPPLRPLERLPLVRFPSCVSSDNRSFPLRDGRCYSSVICFPFTLFLRRQLDFSRRDRPDTTPDRRCRVKIMASTPFLSLSRSHHRGMKPSAPLTR